jgi:hypothetical protein
LLIHAEWDADLMWIFAIQIGIWSAAFVGIAAIAAFGQSSPVLTGTAASRLSRRPPLFSTPTRPPLRDRRVAS